MCIYIDSCVFYCHLKVCSPDPRSPGDTFSSQYFSHTIETLFAFFTMLTFSLMLQKHWWVNGLLLT